MTDLDSESRRNRFTGALDALRDLVVSLPADRTIDPGPLGCLVGLLSAEAHLLYDEEGCGHGPACND